MEQIAKLLFATTLLSIFAYLLIFSSMSVVGNGGEYWGYDGYTEPWRAAGDSFEKGDYRFLKIKLPNANGILLNEVPGIYRCDNHPFGGDNFSRSGLSTPIHGVDSVRLATDFAYEYNLRMASLMEHELGLVCQVLLGM